MAEVLTEGFSNFLRRRRAQWHFQRRPWLDLAVSTPPPAAGVGAGSAELLAAALDDPPAALLRLKSRVVGLDADDAARRLARDGSNEVEHQKPLPGWLHLWRCYLNPFNLLLAALAVLSFASADAKATVKVASWSFFTEHTSVRSPSGASRKARTRARGSAGPAGAPGSKPAAGVRRARFSFGTPFDAAHSLLDR